LIALITHSTDLHATIVAKRLEGLSVPFIRLDTDLVQGTLRLSTDFRSDAAVSIELLSESLYPVNLSDVSSVWLRRIAPCFVDPAITTSSIATFIKDEADTLLRGIYELLSDRFWVSQFRNVLIAENKIYQLSVARKVGFLIPRTLITSSPSDARAFYRECRGEVITKPLSRRYIEEKRKSHLLWTSLVTAESLADDASLLLAPNLLQERIPKHYELRITVVGETVFPCAIYSQTHAATSLDWRHYEVDIPYEAVSIPDSVRESCLHLMHQLGLKYGAFDVIVTPDERYVFLEINPIGQWLWIEEKTGLPITDNLVSLLMREGNIGDFKH
jgi:hypothetical protein